MHRQRVLFLIAFIALVPVSISCSVVDKGIKVDAAEPEIATNATSDTANHVVAEIKLLRSELERSNREVKKQLKELMIEEVLPEIWMVEKRMKNEGESKPKEVKSAKDKIRIGRIEWIKFKDPEFEMQARVDSGAKTCSMHAENIKELQVKGEPYVQFEALDQDGKRYTIVRRVVSRTKVKGTTGVANVRYVIRATIKLGNSLHDVNVNLNDRTRLNYNFLIGRNLLMGNYLVDVSESHLLGDKL